MTERAREADSAIVLQAREGMIVWSPLGSDIEATEMITARESVGDHVLMITSSLDAKKMARDQIDDKQERNFLRSLFRLATISF